MLKIGPFKGYYYNTDVIKNLSDVIAPPYDVVNNKEREILASKSPYNFIKMTLPSNYDPSRSSNEEFYAEAQKRWNNWKKNDIIRLSKPAIWLLKESYVSKNNENLTRYGFMASLNVDDDSDKFVLRHERTHQAPKMDRVNLYKATLSNLSPLFFIYQDNKEETKEFINHFNKLNINTAIFNHRGKVNLELLKTSDLDFIKKFSDSFAEKYALIADGHHRYAASRILNQENNSSKIDTSSLMAYLVPSSTPGLIVEATHRAVFNLNEFNEEKFINNISEYFAITSDKTSSSFSIHTQNKGELKLTPTKQTIKLVESIVKNEFLSKIPVVILEEIILKKMTEMSSEDISHRKNLKYFQDKSICSKELKNNNWNYAITVPPLSVDEIFKVTKSGAIFPQKSTYFYPKAPTGLVMRSMEK